MNSTSLAGCLILVCEDEPLIAMDIADAFKAAGASVVTARSLQNALIAAENVLPSAAIMGHALGDGDSSKLRERLEELGIPIVLYSGFSRIEERGDAVHISKPASPALLVTTVAGLLRRPTLHLDL
jgi:DNA-binding response OmpR family regulator